jgi:hypothetical protein
MTEGFVQRRARRAQVVAELARLRDELTSWFNRWNAPERRAFMVKHRRQLQRLQLTLMDALSELETPLKNLSIQTPTAEVYRRCHDFELRLIWLRRIWNYYRGKFEQRLEPGQEALLQAADEVVWACYAPAYRQLKGSTVLPPPPPLPYIEPQFTPRAIPRDEPPPELKSDVDDEFRQAIMGLLPVAMISLPPACVTAPWWLAHVAHETGHHLQHEFELVTPFQDVLQSAAQANLPADADEGAAQKWRLWNEEIFADFISILCLGQGAPRSLAEAEITSDSLGESYGQYPATVVRLELMRQGLRHLKISDADALGEAMGEQFDVASKNLPSAAGTAFKLAGPIAEAILTSMLINNETMVTLAPFNADAFEETAKQRGWAQRLRDGEAIADKPVRDVRGLVTAGVAAWDQILALDNEGVSTQEEENLRKTLPKNLIDHAEPGDRAAGPTGAVDQGQRLAALLLSRSSSTLEK